MPTWSDWIRLSYQDEWDLRNGHFRPESTFADSEIVQDDDLSRKAVLIRPYYNGFDGLTPKDCGLEGVSQRVDAVLSDLLSFSDQVLIFIPPTTPLQSGNAPACYIPAVSRLLRSKAGPRIVVETGDWHSYGMSWRDYLRPSNRSGYSWLDMIHANYFGAVKITGRIAKLVRRQRPFPAADNKSTVSATPRAISPVGRKP